MPKTLDIAEFRNMIEKTKKLHEDLSSLSHKMDDEVSNPCSGAALWPNISK